MTTRLGLQLLVLGSKGGFITCKEQRYREGGAHPHTTENKFIRPTFKYSRGFFFFKTHVDYTYIQSYIHQSNNHISMSKSIQTLNNTDEFRRFT